MRGRLQVALLVLLAPLAAQGAASAAPPVERGTFSESDVVITDCGSFALEEDFREFGNFATRPANAPLDQAFLARQSVHFHSTATNTTTGKSFTVRYSQVFHELRATYLPDYVPEDPSVEVSDFVYVFEQHEVVTLLIKDARGRPYLQERFVIRYEQVFDTLGDDQPGGVELSFEADVVSGAPFDDVDPCAIAAALTT